MIQMNQIEAAFGAAFSVAIRQVGVTQFKRTSLFGSSQREKLLDKLAA